LAGLDPQSLSIFVRQSLPAGRQARNLLSVVGRGSEKPIKGFSYHRSNPVSNTNL